MTQSDPVTVEFSMVEGVQMMAERRGFGDAMAEGSARLSNQIGHGAEELVMAVRGKELPMHDPRLKNAFGLGYAVSPTGADHMHNMDDTAASNAKNKIMIRLNELGIKDPLPLFGLPEVKVQGFVYETAFKHFSDCAVICNFYVYTFQHMADALNEAAGWNVTIDEIVDIGNRVATLARIYLIREGSTAADDKLPERLFRAFDDGPITGRAMTPEEFQTAIKTYYEKMGWSSEGMPTPQRLAELEIEWAGGVF